MHIYLGRYTPYTYNTIIACSGTPSVRTFSASDQTWRLVARWAPGTHLAWSHALITPETSTRGGICLEVGTKHPPAAPRFAQIYP
jgi:hypothetical protein